MHRGDISRTGEEGEDAEEEDGNSRMKRWRAERQASQTRNAQYVKSLLDRVKGVEKRASFFAGEEELRKLKLGLQAETRKWRAQAAKSMKAQNQKYLFSDSNSKEESDRADIVSRGMNELEDSQGRFLPLSMSAATGEESRRDVDREGKGTVSVSELQIMRLRQKATGGRWRASLELIDSAASAGRERDRGVEILSPSKLNTDGEEEEEEEDRGDRYKTDRSNSKSGGRVGDRSDGVTREVNAEKGTPNYALLIHSCLLLSLSTYNLKVISYQSLLELARSHYCIHNISHIPTHPTLSYPICILLSCQRRSCQETGLTSISAVRERWRKSVTLYPRQLTHLIAL